MNLHQPLHVLPGVGPKSAEKYAKLGIENLQDLLLYFPFRYEDFKTKQVLELEDGEILHVSCPTIRIADWYRRNDLLAIRLIGRPIAHASSSWNRLNMNQSRLQGQG